MATTSRTPPHAHMHAALNAMKPDVPWYFPDLPLELELAIIEWLQEDSSVIASCALVCRRWRPISQSLLFSAVKILTYRQTSDGLQVLTDDIQRIPKFIQFLLTRPNIAAYIQNLHLDGCCRPIDVSFDMFRALVGRLPRLHTLKLDGIVFTIPSNSSMASGQDVDSLVHSKSLSKLTIHYCTTPTHDLSDLLSFLCIFSKIDRLRISGADWTTLSGGMDSYMEYAPMLRSVRLDDIHGACMSTICGMIRASGALEGSLSSVAFGNCTDDPDMGPTQVFADLLLQAGRNLHTLKLILHCYDDSISVVGESLQTKAIRVWRCGELTC